MPLFVYFGDIFHCACAVSIQLPFKI